MSLTIRLDISGFKRKLDLLQKALDPSTIIKVITLRMLSHVDESFTTRGFGNWAPLSQSTLEQRLRGGEEPLQDTGQYKQSWQVLSTDDNSYVTIGSQSDVAAWQEYGTAPHVIKVQRAKTLVARLRDGGFRVFGREVQNPGIPARPVLPQAYAARRMLQFTLNAMVADIMAGGGAST